MSTLALEDAWTAVRESPRDLAARRVLLEALASAGDARVPFLRASLAATEQTLAGHAAALSLHALRETAADWLPHHAQMDGWGDDGLGLVGSIFATLEQVLASGAQFAELGPAVTLQIDAPRKAKPAEISALSALPLDRFHEIELNSAGAPSLMAAMGGARRVSVQEDVTAAQVAQLASQRKVPLTALWVSVADSDDVEAVLTAVVDAPALHTVEDIYISTDSPRLSAKLRAKVSTLPALRRLRLSDETIALTPADELHAAASTPKKLAVLLEAGKAPVDARDYDGMTPLHTACAEGNRAAIELLLRYGADPAARCNDGVTPLSLLLDADSNSRASEILDRIAIAETLLDRSPVDTADESGMTPLVRAMELGRKGLPEAKALERRILAKGPNLHAFSSDLFTHLHFAVVYGSSEVFAASLAAGIPVDARTRRGGTPLWYAAHHDRLEMAEALLDAGADIDAMCDDLEPIAVSLREGNRAVTRLLLDRGAKQQLSEPGYTENLAEFVAAKLGNKAAAKKKGK